MHWGHIIKGIIPTLYENCKDFGFHSDGKGAIKVLWAEKYDYVNKS